MTKIINRDVMVIEDDDVLFKKMSELEDYFATIGLKQRGVSLLDDNDPNIAEHTPEMRVYDVIDTKAAEMYLKIASLSSVFSDRIFGSDKLQPKKGIDVILFSETEKK